MQQQQQPCNRTPHILLGLSGSVAAIKGNELIKLLTDIGELRIVATDAARHFWKPDAAGAGAAGGVDVHKSASEYTDEVEWLNWTKKGDPVLHIELRKWADAFVIAPLSANTLAKISTGLCDNLLVRPIRWKSTTRVAELLSPHTHFRPASLEHGTLASAYRGLFVATKGKENERERFFLPSFFLYDVHHNDSTGQCWWLQR